MKIDASKTPIVHPPHKLPHAIRDRVKAELDEMVKKDVIAVITEPTEWVSQMVATKKKDKDEVICMARCRLIYPALEITVSFTLVTRDIRRTWWDQCIRSNVKKCGVC